MSFCQGKISATVTYTNPQGKRVDYRSTAVPIDVAIKTAVQGTYEFFGTGDDGVFYRHTASGTNPGYKLNSGFNSRGQTPAMNGEFIKPETYYFVSGYGITVIDETQICTIEITDVNQNIFTAQVKCPNGNYKVSCDEDCPPGHIKCEHKYYPGYCCIPCQSTSSKINNLASKARQG